MTRTTDFQSVAVCHWLRQCEFRLENPPLESAFPRIELLPHLFNRQLRHGFPSRVHWSPELVTSP
jgi:hypothetical protein